MKTAKDANQYPLQFGTLVSADYTNVTTSEQVATLTEKYVRITPTTNDAWVKITIASATGTATEGILIPFGSSLTLVIPKAYYITSDTEINVVPYGYA
jgi:hypothetical protein